MIRFIFRLIGLICLAAGFIFAIYDGTKSIADQALFVTRAGDVWTTVHVASQDVVQRWVTGHGLPWVWDPGILNVLAAPAWLILLVVGTVFILIGRRRRPLIGYARS